ncbi:MAG: tRNA dihydrouridine synthase DusB [Planctomycetota bacterium]|nr:MAG: tRNA dihydrouridine synthase DusB [Planctomycetota bacterium]
MKSEDSHQHVLKIGRLSLPGPVIVCPIAGYTDYAYRSILRRYTQALMFAEMVSVSGLIRDGRGSLFRIRKSPDHHPLGIQLFGCEPKLFYEAARKVEEAGFDLVDVNLGCPKIPGEQLAGSRLLRFPKLVGEIIAAMRKAVQIPVTAKIRMGYDVDNLNGHEIAKIVEEEGGDGVTVHGRTCVQKFSGSSNWDWIGQVKSSVSIPVIGNGDLDTPQKVRQFMDYTGVDGVMIGRAALGRPWLIRDMEDFLNGKPLLPTPSLKEMGQDLLYHLSLVKQTEGETGLKRKMRRILSMYFKSMEGVKEFRRKCHQARTYEEIVKLIHQFLEKNTAHDETRAPTHSLL